jgi:hypothetical protein
LSAAATRVRLDTTLRRDSLPQVIPPARR